MGDDNIPQALRDAARWLTWSNDGGRKVPRRASDGAICDATNPANWCRFEEVTGDRGFALGDGFVGVDIDHCLDEWGEPDERAREVLRRVPGYTEISPSGEGLKIFLRGTVSRGRKHNGIEVYGDKRYFTVTGRRVRDWSDEEVDLDAALGDLLPEAGPAPGGPQDPLAAIGRLPLEDVEQMLAWVPADDYDVWYQTGMALRASYGGAGFDVWDRWSQGSTKYPGRDSLEDKWRVLEGTSITVGSVVHRAREAARQAVQGLVDGINDAVAPEAVEQVLERARTLPLGEQEIGRLREIASAALTRITGQDVELSRDDLSAQTPAIERVELFETRAPDWARGWCWLGPMSCYWRYPSAATGGRLVSVESFKVETTILLQARPNGTRPDPHKLMRETWGVPCADSMGYAPGRPRLYRDDIGELVANTFVPGSIPQARDVPGWIDRLLTEFFDYLLPGEQGSLLAWIAEVIQVDRPRPLWAAVLGGGEGIGKSWILQAVVAALGRLNCHLTHGELLRGQFSPWPDLRRFVGVEEMRTPGHSRHEIHNRLKPEITNPRTVLHLKGKQPVEVENTSCYLATTNYPDVLPLDDRDRRFGLYWSDAKREGWGDFGRLFALLGEAGVLRGWFLGHQNADLAYQRPDTQGHRDLVEIGRDDLQDEIERLLEDGAPGVTKNALCMIQLNRLLGLEKGETRRTGPLLKRLGFWFDGRTGVVLDGVRFAPKVWLRPGGTREQVIESLRSIGVSE